MRNIDYSAPLVSGQRFRSAEEFPSLFNSPTESDRGSNYEKTDTYTTAVLHRRFRGRGSGRKQLRTISERGEVPRCRLWQRKRPVSCRLAGLRLRPDAGKGQVCVKRRESVPSSFTISDPAYYALYPHVAYSSTNDEFLVVWIDGRGDVVYGRRVSGVDGTTIGDTFPISGQAAALCAPRRGVLPATVTMLSATAGFPLTSTDAK